MRLSEAMARVHARETIESPDVLEATRLLRKSIINIAKEDMEVFEIQEGLNIVQRKREQERKLKQSAESMVNSTNLKLKTISFLSLVVWLGC